MSTKINEVYKNESYTVTIGQPQLKEFPKGTVVYKVSNISTGVLELETTVLPEALQSAYQFDKMLEEITIRMQQEAQKDAVNDNDNVIQLPPKAEIIH